VRALLLLVTVAAGGCAGSAPLSVAQPTPLVIQATPEIVYVTPDPATLPTPIIVHVTLEPASLPTPLVVYVTAPPAPTQAATPQPTPTPQPVGYRELTNRQWAQLVKAPDDHAGDRVVVWGCITQFDAATGPDQFRANATNKRLRYWYQGDNSYFAGTGSQLAEFVADDVVRMNVTVLGAYTYETTQGGYITVPSFEVDAIERRGGC